MERDSRIIWTNQAYSQYMGYPHGSLIGRYPLEFALPRRLALPREEVQGFLFDEDDDRFGALTQMENVRSDGTEFIHEFSHTPINAGGKTRFLLAGRDITERVAREKALVTARDQLKAQTLTDTLTGLSNRLHLQTCATKMLDAKEPFAVLQIDVDRMKQVNETFGHQAGDAVLRQVARGFRLCAQPDWTCARIGGDNFVVLLPGVTTLEDALAIGRKMAEAISQPFSWKAASLHAGVSIGAAIRDSSVDDMDDLLYRSNIALRHAKSMEGLKLAGYDARLAREHDEAQALERDVAHAVRGRRLSFVFEPIINLETNRVERLEMLVRWRDAERGVVSPDVFLPLIRQLGLSDLLDRFVIDCAEAALKRLDEGGLNHVGLTINLSADAFGSHEIPDLLLWLADDGRIDPSRLCLEITERAAIDPEAPNVPVRSVERLQNAGFSVFPDGFGMGYAGLAHLATLPMSGIKIDRGLTSAVDSDTASRAVAVSLVRLAGELGLDVIAEGVENMAQMEILKAAGCSSFQGFAVSRPMTLKRAIQWAAPDQASPATGTHG